MEYKLDYTSHYSLNKFLSSYQPFFLRRKIYSFPGLKQTNSTSAIGSKLISDEELTCVLMKMVSLYCFSISKGENQYTETPWPLFTRKFDKSNNRMNRDTEKNPLKMLQINDNQLKRRDKFYQRLYSEGFNVDSKTSRQEIYRTTGINFELKEYLVYYAKQHIRPRTLFKSRSLVALRPDRVFHSIQRHRLDDCPNPPPVTNNHRYLQINLFTRCHDRCRQSNRYSWGNQSCFRCSSFTNAKLHREMNDLVEKIEGMKNWTWNEARIKAKWTLDFCKKKSVAKRNLLFSHEEEKRALDQE